MMPTPRKLTAGAIVYTRVSTDAQTEGTSLAAQFAACANKARDLGLPVIAHHEEIESGGLYLSRPKLQAALAAIEAGEASALIVYRLDRAGRDVDALRDVRKRLARVGAELVFADGFSPDAGATGTLMLTTLGAFAEHERAIIRERTTRGRLAVLQSGRQVSRVAAFGYYIVHKADVTRGTHKPEQVGTYEIIEHEAEQVREVFATYLRLQSIRATIDAITARGILTRAGNPFGPKSIAFMLTNEIYIGKARCGRVRRTVDESRMAAGKSIVYMTPQPRESWLSIPAPPIIDLETWDAVQRIIANGNRERSGPRSADNLLTSLVTCPICGGRLNYHKNKNSHVRLRCRRAGRLAGHAEPTCAFLDISGPLVDFLVLDALCWLLESPEVVAAAQREYNESRAAETAANTNAARRSKLEREIARLAQQEARAVRFAMETGSESFAAAATQAAQKRARLAQELEALNDAAPAPSVEIGDGERLIGILRDGDRASRRAVVTSIVSEIVPATNRPRVKGVELTLRTGPGPRYVLTHTLRTLKDYRPSAMRRGDLQIEVRLA